MDTPKTTDCIEFCFGYGGNHLGLKTIIRGLRCIAASEIEAYAIANMVAKMEAGLMDSFPVWSDLRTFPCELFRAIVDILIASYPCQPFSSAGKRKGSEDPRHLWPYVRRAIEIIRPRYVFLENVEGHVSLGLREVLTELALLGYRVENSRGEPTWGIFSAAEVGAPHNRKRVFILAEDGALDNSLREQNEWHNTVRLHGIAGRTGRGVILDDTASMCFEYNGGFRAKSQPPGASMSGIDDMANGPQFGCAEGNPDGGGSRKGTRASKERRGFANNDAVVGVGQADSDNSRGGENRRSGELRPEGLEQSPIDSRGTDTREGREVRGVGLADATEPGSQGRSLPGLPAECRPLFWPDFVSRPNEQQREFEPPRIIGVKRGLGGGVDGRASNVDRLRLLGNGVYPAAAAKAFVTLYRRLIQL